MTWIQIVQLSVYGLMAVWIILDIVDEARSTRLLKRIDRKVREIEQKMQEEWPVSVLEETREAADRYFTQLRTAEPVDLAFEKVMAKTADGDGGEVTELWTEEGKVGEMVSGTDTESDELDGK